MTCIVAIKHNKKIYMGGDAAGVAGYDITPYVHPKVFFNHHDKKFIIGYTHSFRMGQILQYSFKPPEHKGRISDMQYLVSVFIPSLMKCMKKEYFGRIEEGNSAKLGQFIMGYKSNLYCIESDFQVGTTRRDHMTLGCGTDYACGSLYETKKLPPKQRVLNALSAAATYSAGVCKPFTVINS